MNPFNLEQALAGKGVITRNGLAATQFHVFEGAKFPLCAVVDGKVVQYQSDGIFFPGIEHSYDLFMAPNKREGWINIYRDCGTKVQGGGKVYATKEEAEKGIKSEWMYVDTVKIEWEE